MPGYRAYIVGYDGHCSDVHEFAAADRIEAAKAARQLVDGHEVELWEAGEWVVTFKPTKPRCNPIFMRFAQFRRRKTWFKPSSKSD